MRKIDISIFLGIMLAVLVAQFLLPYNEIWDDSYISLLYARNIARGVGPVFLPFSQDVLTEYSRVEGYSNPLWTLALSCLLLLPGSVFGWIKLLSYLMFGVLLLSVRGLFIRLIGIDKSRLLPGWILWIPALLVFLNIPYFAYLKSGMETTSFGALVLAALWHTLHYLDHRHRANGLLNSLLWLLVCLLRPEGILYAAAPGILFLGLLGGRRFSLRSLAEWCLPLVTGLAAFYLWRHHYYGEWLPNTYYAKVHALHIILGMDRQALLRAGWAYVLQFLSLDLPRITALMAVGSIPFLRILQPRALALLVLAFGLNTFAVLWVGGDFWPLSRFLMVSGALLTTIAPIPVAMVLTRNWFAQTTASTLSLVLAGTLIGFQPFIRNAFSWKSHAQPPKSWATQFSEFITADLQTPQFHVARWLKENLPGDTVIATGSCGQIPYYSELETVDLERLTDHHLARHRLDLAYLEERRVAVILFEMNPDTNDPGASYPQIRDDPAFHRRFKLTHWFGGYNQNGVLVPFAMFTRQEPGRDGAGESPWPEGRGPDLTTLLADEDVIRINLGGTIQPAED